MSEIDTLEVESVGEPATGASEGDASPEAPANDANSAKFSVMSVETVTFDLTDPSPVVHLMEAAPPFRYLAIPLALGAATAMHQAIGGVDGRRPGTHELLGEVFRRTQIDVIAARIVRYEGGVFFGQLDLMTPRGREVFDCRTSDAITIAMRQNVPAPVLCAEEVLAALYD